jgi:hypothetical protein
MKDDTGGRVPGVTNFGIAVRVRDADVVLVSPFEDDHAGQRFVFALGVVAHELDFDEGVDGATPRFAAVHAWERSVNALVLRECSVIGRRWYTNLCSSIHSLRSHPVGRTVMSVSVL